eukprot:scaffold81290_cov59-Phaeocystis_antarctica.AAC.3
MGREWRSADGCRDVKVQKQGYMQWVESMDMHIGAECGARRGSSHLLRRRDRRKRVLLEPGANVGEQLDLLDGGVGLVRALVAQPKLLAAAACRSRRRELQVAHGRQHCGRDGRWVAPAVVKIGLQSLLLCFPEEAKVMAQKYFRSTTSSAPVPLGRESSPTLPVSAQGARRGEELERAGRAGPCAAPPTVSVVVQRFRDHADCVRATSTHVGRVVVHDEGRRGRLLILLSTSRGERCQGIRDGASRYGRGERCGAEAGVEGA